VIVKKDPHVDMDDSELASTIQTEAAQHIPFDIIDVSVDYQILSEGRWLAADGRSAGRGEEGQDTQLHQRALAGRKDAGDRRHRRFALQNCYEYNYDPAPTSTVALLNLGASVMNINIVKGVTPLFTATSASAQSIH